MLSKNKKTIAVIGLGYVGHPLAINFGKTIDTIGFDISKKKILDFRKKIDRMCIFKKSDFKKAKFLRYEFNSASIKEAKYKIIALPTPIYKNMNPDLSLLKKGCILCAKNLKKKDVVVIESTVYPGATEEVLIPILEKFSKLKYNVDFFVAYAPERINPGDSKNNLKSIVKVVSSNNLNIAKDLKSLYSKIIKKVYIAPSLKIAEAAKVIENTQRDVNIALINEFTMLFDKLNIDPKEVIKTASTKWNFLKFYPGLVGGHCIGVDPYYLKYKADEVKFDSKIITSGRLVNEKLIDFLLKKILNFFRKNKLLLNNVIILGATYKENVSDFRNSKIIELAKKLASKNIKVNIHDPFFERKPQYKNKKIKIHDWRNLPKKTDLLIYAVPHEFYKKKIFSVIKKRLKKNHLFFDLRSQLKKSLVKKINKGYMSL